MNERIHFVCPNCDATHDRGCVDGVSIFRCLKCGYQGHGFDTDLENDAAVFAEHQQANATNRALGIPEVPLGDDPLNHGC